MGQEVLDAAVHVSGQPRQHVLEVDPRVVPVEPGRLRQAHDDGGALAGEFAAGEVRCTVNRGQQNLGCACLVVELSGEDGRRQVAQARVASLAVVKDLDPLGNGGLGFSAGGEAPVMDELGLEAAPEALHRGVVVAVSPA